MADTIDSVMLEGLGPMAGTGMPYAGPYSNVYGITPAAGSAESAYYDTMNRGYENQQTQLMQDAFGKLGWNALSGYTDWTRGITMDPATGEYKFDYNKLTDADKKAAPAELYQKEFEYRIKNRTDDKAMQARQQLQALAQKQMAQRAKTEQMVAERAGFQRELQRYNAPNLMAQMINPAIQQAGNQVMANANAAGMAGGSMAQAANRRAAMSGFGQQAANVVPQAAVQQNETNFQWQKAREGMINNYYGMQNQRAQQDLANSMAVTGFKQGLEQYQHSRDREDLNAVGGFLGNVGAFGAQAAPFLKVGGGSKGA